MKPSGWINGAWILVLILGLAGVSWGADKGPISSGETKSGTITGPSFLDTWTFQGTAGDWIIITAVTIPGSGTLNTAICLYPPDGGPAEVCPPNAGDFLDHQLAQSGLYTIVIFDGFFLSRMGDYNISLTKIPSTLRPGLYNPSPPSGATLPVPLCSSLSWDPVGGATGYDLYFGEDVVEPLEKIGD